MARKIIEALVDDIDGGEANETVTFGLDGVTYEIDLNEEHAAELRAALETWTARARRVAGRRRSGTGAARPAKSSPSRNQKIRDWARENGHELSDRGRIPADVVAAYEAANEA